MPSLPYISVILPIFNESAYIKNTLDSIVLQDYPPELMEIIIVDGNSRDTTHAIIREFAILHPKYSIQIFANPWQIVPVAMNIGIRNSHGDIIFRIDGHCVISPDYLQNCVKHIQDGNVDVVGGSMTSVGESFIAQAIAIGVSSPFGVGNSAFRTVSGKSMLVDTVPFPAYTREILDKAGFFDEELVRNQDDEYNYRIRKLGGKILLASDVHSSYYSRTSLIGLLKQYFQYGYWKVRVLQKHPLQMSIRQFVPPLFTLSLMISLGLFFLPQVWLLSPVIPGLYLIANVIASIQTASKRGWGMLPLLPMIFFILHFSYGAGFWAGFIHFWNRWGDKTGRTPVVAAYISANDFVKQEDRVLL